MDIVCAGVIMIKPGNYQQQHIDDDDNNNNNNNKNKNIINSINKDIKGRL